MYLKKIIKNTLLCLAKIPQKTYKFFIRQETIMNQGVELYVDTTPLNKIDPRYGDWLIHPCVRYIPEGIAGHKWWMVVTPYPNYNSYYENPVLYHGDGNEDTPPEIWKFVKIVQSPHKEGYNADCNLYYDSERLWIIWKEASTTNTKSSKGEKCIMGCFYNGIAFSDPIKICENLDETNMYIASPVLTCILGQTKMLSVFTPNSYRSVPNRLKGPRHIAVFGIGEGKIGKECFQFERVVRQDYPQEFDFWHIDTFSYNNKYYCLVTPESADRILLGESDDGIHFHFFDKPLLHANGKERTPYTYKVSGVIIGENFYMFYPMRKKENGIVHIFSTHENFEKLLKKLK